MNFSKRKSANYDTSNGFRGSLIQHAEIANDINPDQIVYKEKDIIMLLKKLGFPDPEFGDRVNLDAYSLDETCTTFASYRQTLEHNSLTPAIKRNALKFLITKLLQEFRSKYAV